MLLLVCYSSAADLESHDGKLMTPKLIHHVHSYHENGSLPADTHRYPYLDTFLSVMGWDHNILVGLQDYNGTYLVDRFPFEPNFNTLPDEAGNTYHEQAHWLSEKLHEAKQKEVEFRNSGHYAAMKKAQACQPLLDRQVKYYERLDWRENLFQRLSSEAFDRLTMEISMDALRDEIAPTRFTVERATAEGIVFTDPSGEHAFTLTKHFETVSTIFGVGSAPANLYYDMERGWLLRHSKNILIRPDTRGELPVNVTFTCAK